jgi:peroxiredoxin
MKNIFILLFFFTSLKAHGQIAPSFRAERLDGSKISLDSILKKDRVTLISFWATWCIPCIEELVSLEKNLAKNPQTPVDVYIVNVDQSETRTELNSVLTQYKIPFNVLLDPTSEILLRYQPTKALPFSVLVSSQGEILETFTGLQKSLWDKIEKHGKLLLSTRKGDG